MPPDAHRYQNEIDRIRKRGDEYRDQNTNFAFQNITQLRTFHQHLATISLLALAPIFAVLSTKPELIGTPVFAVLGAMLLFGTATTSTLYLNRILVGENNKLGGLRKLFSTAIQEEITALEESCRRRIPFDTYLTSSERQDRQQQYSAKEGTLHCPTIEVDDYADFSTRCFILGLLLIGLSFVQ